MTGHPQRLHIVLGRPIEEYESIDTALEAARNQAYTTRRTSHTDRFIGQPIQHISWSARHLAFHLPNHRYLGIVATPNGHELTARPEKSGSDPVTVNLLFEEDAEPIVWNRESLFDLLYGSTITSIQTSPDFVFIGTRECETLIFSVLFVEPVSTGDPYILYWGFA